MLQILRRELIYLWYYSDIQLRQIFVYWAFGIVLGSIISVFGKGRIHAAFSRMGKRKLGILGMIPASFLGIASPLCMYGTIPIAASFSRQGIRDDYLAAFMMSSMLINPQLIIYSAALGKTALIIRIASCFLCGVLAGLLIRFFYREKSFFDFSGFGQAYNRDTDPNLLIRLLKNIGRNIRATGPWFLAGILLTALYQRYVPGEWVENLFERNCGFGVLLAAAVGVPIYVCGGGTIPLLMDWLANGMSMGSAAAFMITGPATKITNLGAVKTVLGIRGFLIYLIYVALFAVATGALVDLVIR